MIMLRKKVAVVGTGIAGMAAAYFLRRKYDVSLFEREGRPGGHTHTVTVREKDRPIPIDTGFMVYNEVTYPNLVRFFKRLDIPTKDTSMSFSVQHLASGLEYCGSGFLGLFAQRRNIFNGAHWKMLLDINCFNRECPEILEDPRYLSMTIADYVHQKRLRKDVLEKYLLPMGSAIWSTPLTQMNDFPAVTLVRFFKNHGLLGLTTHHQWKTVEGGSQVYRDKILSLFPQALSLDSEIKKVIRGEGGVTLVDQRGRSQSFDLVVLACHADEALAMIDSPRAFEHQTLSKFRYTANTACLHTDPSVMPKRRQAWSSWNYRVEKNGDAHTIYWMNSLQQVSKNKNYFVSINDPGKISRDSILWQATYTHPVYDKDAIVAQSRLEDLNASGPVYFCGSYFKNGFHEDAFTSGLTLAEHILRDDPWL